MNGLNQTLSKPLKLLIKFGPCTHYNYNQGKRNDYIYKTFILYQHILLLLLLLLLL